VYISNLSTCCKRVPHGIIKTAITGSSNYVDLFTDAGISRGEVNIGADIYSYTPLTLKHASHVRASGDVKKTACFNNPNTCILT